MRPEDAELEALVRAAQRGDEVARGRLLALVRPRVYRWALVQTSAPDDAEDITQQALLRVHRKLADFSFGARFTTWVYAVTRSTAADWRRTRQRRASLLERHGPVDAHVAAETPGSALVALVREHLGGLPARQRELFDLVDLQGYTPAEAAELLDMNPNTARVHVLRARRTVRTRILAAHPRLLEELR